MTVGAQLKELRLKKGASLQQVADAVGVTKAHIWSIEKCPQNNPSINLLRRLAEHFGVTVARLVGETIEGGDEQLMKMYLDLKGLSESDRTLIADIIACVRRRGRSD